MALEYLFLEYLPVEQIVKALMRAPGNELESGKFASPESSSALAVNTFGYFLEEPSRFPMLPELSDVGLPALRVSIEEEMRFPWPGGKHPWLDAVLETESHVIGIESKRFEPFRHRKSTSISEAYWRPVWGDKMGPFEQVRDDLASGNLTFAHLDATQLFKHAFGLRTQAQLRSKKPILVYLFDEPPCWSDGRSITPNKFEKHRAEVREFAEKVASAEVDFRYLTYANLLSSFRSSPDAELAMHADRLAEKFGIR